MEVEGLLFVKKTIAKTGKPELMIHTPFKMLKPDDFKIQKLE